MRRAIRVNTDRKNKMARGKRGWRGRFADLLMIYTFTAVLLPFASQAQISQYVIEDAPKEIGIYKGKDLYFISNSTDHTEHLHLYRINVNKKFDTTFALDWTKKDIVQLKLEKWNFKPGDTVRIYISGTPDAPGLRLLETPSLQRIVSSFEVTQITCTPDGQLFWSVKNDTIGCAYYVEHFRWNRWIRLGKVHSSTNGKNAFGFSFNPHSGENQVRITNGLGRYSKPFKFTSNVQDPSDHGCHSDLRFKFATDYEVYDKHGILVLKGRGDKIDTKILEPGVYYLNYDSKTTQFIRKK
jgi:hypothetical protein